MSLCKNVCESSERRLMSWFSVAVFVASMTGFTATALAQSADDPPSDTAPADTAPADTAPADTAPANTAPANTAPANVAPANVAPADESGTGSVPEAIPTSYSEWFERMMDKAHKPFEFHGYFRAGFGMNHNGGDLDSFRTPATGGQRWRLGNEDDNYIEAIFVNNWLNPERDISKAWLRSRLNFSFITGQNNNFDETDVRIREAYAEAGNVIGSAPDVRLWAGQRFYRRHDIHVLDFFYLSNSGYGGGVENLDLGFGKLHIAFIGGSSDDRVVDNDNDDDAYDSDPDLISGDLGRPTKAGFDIRISDIKVPGGTGIFWLWLVRNSKAGGGVDGSAEIDGSNGVAAGFLHTANDFFGGFNKFTVQYGLGPASNFDTFGVSGQDKDEWRLRITESFVIQTSPKLSMMGAAVYEYSDNGLSDVLEFKRSWATIGVTPIYHFTKHIGLATELAYQYVNVKGDDSATGSLIKFAVAPVITPEAGFWGRPQIRLFAAGWYFTDDIAVNYGQYADDNIAVNFGVQAEAWW